MWRRRRADCDLRRSLLGARSVASTASVALAAPTAPSIDPDAALIARRSDYDRTRQAWQAYWPTHTAAEQRYFALRHDDDEEDEAELRQASGLADVEPIYEGLENVNHDVVLAMVDEPARTLRGLIAKAEVSQVEDNMVPELIASIVADLLAMKPAA